jgi:peptidoglycan/xylan/chitin deacetylase (PgdA/CDA1 family)
MRAVRGVLDRAVVAAAGSVAFAELVARLERWSPRAPRRFHVLTYHRVDEPAARPTLSPVLVSAAPEAFEAQMAYLAAHCTVLSLPELLRAFDTGAELPRRAVLITFDDAYRDFAGHAWPILKRFRLPVTLFVPTAYPDHPERAFWWDRLYAALSTTDRPVVETPWGRLALATPGQRQQAFRRLRQHVKSLPHAAAMAWVDRTCAQLGGTAPEPWILSWPELRRLGAEGVTLAPHSRTHPLLHRLPPEEARAEVAGSLADLEAAVGPTPAVLAYPGGGLDDGVVRTVAEEGFRLAFTTARGANDLRRADPLRVRRVHVGRRATLAVLRWRLLPWAPDPARLRESGARVSGPVLGDPVGFDVLGR